MLPEPSARRADHLEAIAKLTENNPPARFGTTARRLVQVFCGDYLKAEPLDEMVLLVSGNDNETEQVLRKDVKVVLKDGKTVVLSPSGFDEYNLPRDRLDYFLLPMGGSRDPPGDKDVAPLKGTKYSDAIKAYNEKRNRIKHWSEPGLRDLRATCEAHKADLAQGGGEKAGGRTLIERIDRLLEIMHKHPNLFVASEP